MSRSYTKWVGVFLFLAGSGLALAETPPAITAEAERLDARFDALMENGDKTMEAVDLLNKEVTEHYERIRSMGSERSNMSPEIQTRARALMSGDELRQLEALRGLDAFGDGGRMIAMAAAKQSPHETVRRRAIDAALEQREDGYVVLVYSFRDLPLEDQVYVVEKLAEHPDKNHKLLLAVLEKAEPEVREVVIGAGRELGGEEGLHLAIMAAQETDELLAQPLIDAGQAFDEDARLLLYFLMARSDEPAYQIEGVKAAAALSEENRWRGLVTVDAAFDSRDPEVRSALVQAARLIGGEDGQAMIDEALNDSNGYLVRAARDALADE